MVYPCIAVESSWGIGERLSASRTFSRKRSNGKLLVLGVRLDRFDHQVECTGTVLLSCHTARQIGRKAEAFGEVEQAINALSVAVQQGEHRTGAISRPLEQEQMIGTEVEHGGRTRQKEREPKAPACLGRAVVGLAGGLLRHGYHRSAAHDRSRPLGRRFGFLIGFAQTLATQQEDLGVLYEPVGDGGGRAMLLRELVANTDVGHGAARIIAAHRWFSGLFWRSRCSTGSLTMSECDLAAGSEAEPWDQ